MNKTHIIVVEYRKPSKQEKARKLFGETKTINGVTRIFIDSSRPIRDIIDTFFHEVAHAFNHFHNMKINRKEELLCRLIGNLIEPCYRKWGK